MQTALPEAVGNPGPSGESLPEHSFCSQIAHYVFLLAGCTPAPSSAASQSDSTKRVILQFNCNSAYICSTQYSNVSQVLMQNTAISSLRSIIKGNVGLYVMLHKLIMEPI